MKTITKALAATTLALGAAQSFAEISANATVVSDYVFRGITQTDNGAALQAGLDYSHSSGAYASLWASNVDFGDDTTLEYDYIAGYATEISGVGIDAGYVSYNYNEGGTTLAEFYLALSYTDASFSFYRDQDYGYSYYNLGYDFALPSDYTLSLAGGITANAGEAENVNDALISVGKSFALADVALSVSYLEGAEGTDAETTAFISVGKSF